MRSGKISAARVMKYIVLGLIVIFIVVMMLFMSGSSRPFEEVKDAVEGSLDPEELTAQDSARLKRDLGLNAADYSGVVYYSAESNISASEVLLVKVRRDDQIQPVLDAVEQRRESRMNDFEDYLPEQAGLIADARQSVRGTYIFYAVSPKADDYLAAFGSSL